MGFQGFVVTASRKFLTVNSLRGQRSMKLVEIFVTENDKDRVPVSKSREPDLCPKVLTVMAQARLC